MQFSLGSEGSWLEERKGKGRQYYPPTYRDDSALGALQHEKMCLQGPALAGASASVVVPAAAPVVAPPPVPVAAPVLAATAPFAAAGGAVSALAGGGTDAMPRGLIRTCSLSRPSVVNWRSVLRKKSKLRTIDYRRIDL